MPASLDAFARAVESDTGDPRLLSGEGTGMYVLGGRVPFLIARPASHEAVLSVLARASEEGLGVVPWGGGTGRRAGYPPERYEVALSTERLAAAVDFLRDDLTAVVQPGMTIESLNRLTRPEGQTAGLDPANPGRATVGGAIFAERSGPMRVRWGRARDRVMRLKVALPDGSSHTYGALVVKNVTGYDMNRLLAGSWGTLAVATELALRLYKAPERTGARAAAFPEAGAALAAARCLMALPLHPLWVEVLDAGRLAALGERYSLPGPWCLAAAFGDFEEGLAEQLRRFEDLLSREGGRDLARFDDEAAARLGAALADQPGGDFAREEALAVRASGRADQLPRFARAAEEAARKGGFRLAAAAHAGSGVLRAWLAPEERGVEPRAAWDAFAALCRAGADPARGRAVHLRLDSGPAALRDQIAVWGEDGLDPAALGLMRRLKREYDPTRTLSPGRFVGRL